MTISQFVSGTIWLAILLISSGLITGYFESSFIVWFFLRIFLLRWIDEVVCGKTRST